MCQDLQIIHVSSLSLHCIPCSSFFSSLSLLTVLGGIPSIAAHKDDWLKWIPSTRTEYGEVWTFKPLGNERNIIITFNPEDVEWFLVKNFKNYIRNSNIPRFDELFGNTGAIFTSNGDHWKVQFPHNHNTYIQPNLPSSFIHSPSETQPSLCFVVKLFGQCWMCFLTEHQPFVTFCNNTWKVESLWIFKSCFIDIPWIPLAKLGTSFLVDQHLLSVAKTFLSLSLSQIWHQHW